METIYKQKNYLPNVPVENTTTESNTTSVITDQVKQEINSLKVQAIILLHQ